MSLSQIYIAISIAILAIITLLVFSLNKKEKKLSKLAGLSFAFIIAGNIFGDDRLVGYGLMGVGNSRNY